MNMIEENKRFLKEMLKVYKRIFSGTIKESFLCEMIIGIYNDPRYVSIYNFYNSTKEIVSFESVLLGNTHFLNISKMIVMAHYANTVTLSEEEKGKLQKDEKYKNKLRNEVLAMYSIQKLATSEYSNSSLEAFLPLIYYFSVLTNFCCLKYDEAIRKNIKVNKEYNDEFNKDIIYKMLIKFRTCIFLADSRAIDELLVVFRSLVELFMCYSALWDQNDAIIKAFYECDEVTREYNISGKIPDKIKSKKKGQSGNIINFMNYGWLDGIDEFRSIKKSLNDYSIKSLSKILDKKCGYFSPKFGSELYKMYKICNSPIHGSLIKMNYFETELYVFQNLSVMLNFICEIISKHLFNFNFTINDISLVEVLENEVNKSRDTYLWLNGVDKNLHKTNIEYQSRALCCMRMKE